MSKNPTILSLFKEKLDLELAKNLKSGIYFDDQIKGTNNTTYKRRCLGDGTFLFYWKAAQ